MPLRVAHRLPLRSASAPSLLRCSVRRGTATASRIITTALCAPHLAQRRATSSSSSSSSASAADPAVGLFAQRLLTSPHRDATQQPYGEWFSLYVRVRRGWKAARQGDAQQQQMDAKTAIDALLWTSLFARHWTEVEEKALLSPTASHYRWWWKAEASLRTAVDTPAPLELCSAAFLTEPLLGGRYLQQWIADVRASSTEAAAPSAPTDDSRTDAPTVLLPFSAVWAIKQSAYWRPSQPQSAALGTALPSFSLQERQARQSLLHTMDQLLQLQADAATHRNGVHQRIAVISPTEEWDLLCDAPRLRQSLRLSHATVVPPWLSLGPLCEDGVARLAYCAHALDWQRRRNQAMPSESASLRSSVRVLSPSTEHAHLRSFALTSVHEHSSAKTALSSRHAARLQSSASAVGRGAAVTTVHGQARKGCSDAVRRMAIREENIRQSFSVR